MGPQAFTKRYQTPQSGCAYQTDEFEKGASAACLDPGTNTVAPTTDVELAAPHALLPRADGATVLGFTFQSCLAGGYFKA